MLYSPQSLAAQSKEVLKQGVSQNLHGIIETTFTGEKLNLPYEQLFSLMEEVKKSEKVLTKTRLLQYGLMTTLIEEVEKHIAYLGHDEQKIQRELLYQSLKDDPLPLASKDEMLTIEGAHICAAGTSNLNNNTYNLLLRPISVDKYALVFDCDLHHPGIAVLDKTLPLLNPSIQEGVLLWKKNNSDSFYQRQPASIFGKKSQVVRYQEEGLDVFIERGFDKGVLTDKPRLTISVCGFSENQLDKAQAVVKHALFRLGLGTIAYPQRPVDRMRARIFAANRATHQSNEAGRLLSYDQERDLKNYDFCLDDLKKTLNYKAADVLQTYEEEVMPGRTVWINDALETKIKGNIAPLLYHEIFRVREIPLEQIEAKIKAILSIGLQSSAHRFRHGSGIEGISSSSDMNTGGGNSVFTRTYKIDDTTLLEDESQGCAFILDTHSTKQVSTYMYDTDAYGTKQADGSYPSRKAPYQVTQKERLAYNNEVMVKQAIPPSSIIGMYISRNLYQRLKTTFDKAITDSGILARTGKTLAEFIVHSTQNANALAIQQPAKSYVNQMVYKKNIEKNAKQQNALSEKADPDSHVAKRRKLSE